MSRLPAGAACAMDARLRASGPRSAVPAPRPRRRLRRENRAERLLMRANLRPRAAPLLHAAGVACVAAKRLAGFASPSGPDVAPRAVLAQNFLPLPNTIDVQ
jgi:hypothetical protein